MFEPFFHLTERLVLHRDYWETLKGHLHDIDDLVVDDNEVGALKSLQDYEEEVQFRFFLYDGIR